MQILQDLYNPQRILVGKKSRLIGRQEMKTCLRSVPTEGLCMLLYTDIQSHKWNSLSYLHLTLSQFCSILHIHIVHPILGPAILPRGEYNNKFLECRGARTL